MTIWLKVIRSVGRTLVDVGDAVAVVVAVAAVVGALLARGLTRRLTRLTEVAEPRRAQECVADRVSKDPLQLDKAASDLVQGGAAGAENGGEGADREAQLRQLAAGPAQLVFGVGFLFTDDQAPPARGAAGFPLAVADAALNANRTLFRRFYTVGAISADEPDAREFLKKIGADPDAILAPE